VIPKRNTKRTEAALPDARARRMRIDRIFAQVIDTLVTLLQPDDVPDDVIAAVYEGIMNRLKNN